MQKALNKLVKTAIARAEMREENGNTYSEKNISDIDRERLLTYVLQYHAEIAADKKLRQLVTEAACVPKKKKYRLYDNADLIDWLGSVIYDSNISHAEIDNISEEDCSQFFEYVIDTYGELLGKDETFLDGLCLLMATEVNGYPTEIYRM